MSGQDVRLKAFHLTAFLIDAEPSDFFFLNFFWSFQQILLYAAIEVNY